MDEEVIYSDFQGCGTEEGLVIWVIKSTSSIEAILSEKFGHFDDTLTYLCLQTQGSPPHSWNVYFWLGENSAPDRHCLAAYKATELDRFLKNQANLHREVQNYESAAFLAIFKGNLRYEKGSSEACLKSIKGIIPKKLYQIKGKKHCRVSEVPFHFDSLNQDDVFILDGGDRIFVWNGPHSNNGEKVKGAEVARNIRDFERAGRAKIEFIDDEWDSHVEFFDLLDSKPLPAVHRADDDDEKAEARVSTVMQMFKVSDASGKLILEHIEGKPSYKNLDTNDCFFLDTGSEASGLYVWVGKNCTDQERKGVFDNALEYLKRRRLPSHTPICKINENHEPALFRALLNFPPDKIKVNQCHTTSKGIAQIDSTEAIDIAKMQSTKKLTKSISIDAGNGKKKVWRIAAFDVHLVPEKDYGIFYGGDSYIVLYMSPKVPEGIIYYWLGHHSTTDEKATAAIFVNKIDESECKGKATQMRIVQFKEPEHFLKMFNNAIVILKGGAQSGFNMSRTALKEFRPSFGFKNAPQMFQIRGRRIVEVELTARSLNSNDIFFVKVLYRHGYTWIGKGANEEEHETAWKLVDIFDLDENQEEPEGDESEEFWEAIGGKEDYAKGARLEDPCPEYASRLFHCSNAKGKFTVEEIVDFNQQDLESDDIMILDTFDDIYVWIGKNSNIQEKKAALDTVLRYVAADKSGRTEENTNLLVVKQGFEPLSFKAHFGLWDDHLWENEVGYDKLKELITRNVDFTPNSVTAPIPVRQMEAEFTKTHPIHILRVPVEDLPFGVDPANKEKHLSEADFLQVFGINKKKYDSLSKWRQIELKKKVGLF